MSRRQPLLSSVRRVVVKVGSQIIAPQGELDAERVHSIGAGLKRLHDQGIAVVLVTSGAVAAGRRKLGLVERPQSIPLKQASAAAGQVAIMQLWASSLEPALRVAQVLLTAEDMNIRSRFLNARNTFESLLALKVLPIVNENDTVAVEEIKLGDNDRLSALVASLVEAQLLVLLTDVDGFFDEDPTRSFTAIRHSWLDEVEDEHLSQAGPTRSSVGLGGMRTKLEAARLAGRAGVSTVIANGTLDDVLERIMADEDLGTWVAAPSTAVSQRKHWIAFSRKSAGRIAIDSGAVVALMEHGRSLLPSGIVGVEGEFGRGDSIAIVDLEGREIARGLAGYSSADLRRIAGCRSAEIETILGYRYLDEAVHRDDLVVLVEDS